MRKHKQAPGCKSTTIMKIPLVSVIVPTAGRSHLVPRAIHSALALKDVEVIVVPNGDDTSWRDALGEFAANQNVRAFPIEKKHANAARNAGLRLAKGKYVRFLDDDDFFFPEAERQHEQIEEAGAEACSGRVISLDVNLTPAGMTSFPASPDFVCASLQFSGLSLPTGNIFLRQVLDRATWDEFAPINQDYVWMLHLATLREWHWIQSPETVGAWVHHSHSRVSSKAAPIERPIWILRAIRSLRDELMQSGRMNTERRSALAAAMWRIAHNRFALDPLFSHKVAQEALALDVHSRPPDYFLEGSLFDSAKTSLIVEWLMLPKRRLNHYKRLISDIGREDYVRYI